MALRLARSFMAVRVCGVGRGGRGRGALTRRSWRDSSGVRDAGAQPCSFCRRSTMPARSRSQVSAVTPSLRNSCLSTLLLGVFGSSASVR
ncbi:MAG: hypothetical protein ACK56I_20090, partial [bacterium]